VISAFFVVVAGLVFRAHMSKPQTGTGGLLDEIGIVKTAIDPEGKVFVHGELWQARSTEPIDVGTKVRVIGVDNLIIDVETLSEKTDDA
jgi:membrane-bound serine protease (ClpP class)